MARLVLIRHGESVANRELRFTTGPHEALTRRGRSEAERIALRVRERHDPVALYASPFVRALETARLVGRAFGLEPRVVDALQEQHFGALHGRPYADYRRDPSAGGLGAWDLRPPGGETLREVALRAGPALDAIARRHVGEEVVVVSHGGVMAALRGWAAGDLEGPPLPSRNAEGFVLLWREDRYAPPELLSLEE